MHAGELYSGTFKILANDTTIIELLNIDMSVSEEAQDLQKAFKIQKRRQPQNLITDMPLISFYCPGGGVSPNNRSVYTSRMVFDCYTADDPDTALKLHERLTQLFSDDITNLSGMENAETQFVSCHESSVDIRNCYCFTTVFDFSILLDS